MMITLLGPHLLVAVLEDGRQARQQVLDGGRHAAHAHHVHDGLQSGHDIGPLSSST